MAKNRKNEGSPGNPAPGLKILIADDNRENRYLLESMLGAEGYGTESASNGIEALELLKQEHFDAIISDLLMPKMDGFALIRACKKDPALSTIPFIIYTATYTETKDVEFGLSLGAVRYIIKPAEPDVLLRELDAALGMITGEGTMDVPAHPPLENGKADQEYARRLVAKLDKKILELEKSEEKYRTVFENTGTATVVVGETNIIELANDEFVKLSGFSREEIEKKKSWTEFVVEEDLERMLAQHRLRRQDPAKALSRYEFRFVTRSGDIRNIYLTIDVIPGTGESIASLLDITDRKKAEAALKESNDRFRLLFEQSPVPYQSLDAHGRFLEVNDAWLTMLGYTRDEVIGHWFGDFVAPAYAGVFRENFPKFKASGETHVEFAMKRKDGSLITVAFDGKVGHYPDGSFRQTHCVWRDITREKQAEEALRDLSAYNRSLIEASLDPLVTISPDGKIQDVNIATEMATGVTRNELIGKDFSLYFSDPEKAREGYLRAFSEGKVVDFPLEIRHRSGPGMPVLYNATVYHDRKGDVGGIFAAARDITRLNQAKEALQKSEEKFRNVFDWANDAIFLHTLTTKESPGRFIDANEVACRMLGYARDELLTMGPPDIVPPDHHYLLGEIIRQAAEKNYSALFETRFLRKDKTTFPVESNAHLVTFEGKKIWISHVRDITGRKEAEEQRELLIRELGAKNAELDRFTYTVSHDLKSPLLSIRAFLSLLEDDIKSGNTERVNSDITRMNESAEKLENLITTLLALSRSGRSVDTPVRVPFADLLREAARMLDASFKKRGVTLVIPESLPVVTGDRQRLLQVMTNLLDNAVRFMGDQKDPRVEVGVQPGDTCPVFFVRDNGMGIKKEDLVKIFGLYERLNCEIPGNGIGLATVKRIIEAHGGKIWAESEGEGKGTTVCFTLPVADADTGKNA